MTSGNRPTARLYSGGRPPRRRSRAVRPVFTGRTNLAGTLMAPTRMPEDTDLHELVAAYALNALDDGDRATFEEHLATCERCAAELAELRETAAAFADVPDT